MHPRTAGLFVLPVLMALPLPFLLAAAPHPASSKSTQKPIHDYKKWEQTIAEEFGPNLPGGYAFAIMENGKIVYTGVEGWARGPKEKTDPALRWTLDKPQPIASVSKAITAVAVMHLLDQSAGKITVDTPFWPLIRRVVPAAGEDDKKITIKNLLQHTSGFPHDKTLGDVNSPATLEKLMRLPMAHKPGEVGDYDNNNYYALRVVIEEVSHYSYTGYVKQEILKPMGIDDMETHYEHDRPTLGYTKASEKRPGFPFDWDVTTTAGAAGWYASVDDLCHFVRGIREQTVLSPESTKALLDNSYGFDRDHPWVKMGDWGWDTDQYAGHVQSGIMYGEDGYDGVVLVNCDTLKAPVDVLADAWTKSKVAGKP